MFFRNQLSRHHLLCLCLCDAEETAVAKGIRRITGATGLLALSAKEAADVLNRQYRAIQLSMQGSAVDIDQIDTEIIGLR